MELVALTMQDYGEDAEGRVAARAQHGVACVAVAGGISEAFYARNWSYLIGFDFD
jgi:hypothetical protein